MKRSRIVAGQKLSHLDGTPVEFFRLAESALGNLQCSERKHRLNQPTNRHHRRVAVHDLLSPTDSLQTQWFGLSVALSDRPQEVLQACQGIAKVRVPLTGDRLTAP